MATKSRSKHQEGLYKTYQARGTYEVNRKRRLTRALKRNPENDQIATALKSIKYRRKTPKAPQWSHTEKNWAQTKAAFAKPNAGTQRKMTEKEMFKLRARAHDAEGNLIWNF